MDKSTNVHTKVAATFATVYYNALANGKIAEVEKMYTPTAKVNHFNVEGISAALAAFAKGARFNVASVDTTLVDNARVKLFIKGTVTIGLEKKDFTHDLELIHHATTASQLSFGVTSDTMRASAVPPPPKMKFDDWAADTPQLAAQNEAADGVPTMDLITSKDVTPQATPQVAPKAVTPAEEKKVEEVAVAAPVAAPVAEEKKVVEEVAAPAAPKGWANIVRADKVAVKAVVSVVDPTKKVAAPVEKKDEKAEEGRKGRGERKPKAAVEGEDAEGAAKTEGSEKKDGERKERRSAKSAVPIFYDIFVKGFPVGTTEAEVPAALSVKVAISNTKIDTKEDRSGVKRVFVYVKLSAEDLAAQKTTREEAIAAIVAANKGAKHNGARLTVEEVKERYNADGTAATKDAAAKINGKK